MMMPALVAVSDLCSPASPRVLANEATQALRLGVGREMKQSKPPARQLVPLVGMFSCPTGRQ